MSSYMYSDLSKADLELIKRIKNKKSSPEWILTPDMAKNIWELSLKIKKQVGILIDRKGVVKELGIGDYNQIFIPPINGFPIIPTKLRGLRFIRTSLDRKLLDDDDINDLTILRLDSISVLTGDSIDIKSMETAHLLPPQQDTISNTIPYDILDNRNPYINNFNYIDFVYNLEKEISSKTKKLYGLEHKNSAILIGSFNRKSIVGERMEELMELVKSAKINVLGIETQIRDKINPVTVVGMGKIHDIMIAASIKGADILVFENSLTPSQYRNISDITEMTIMDRTQIILNIFKERAKSNEGKIRVELARLKYFLPYLVGSYDNLSRITGGLDTKGPGETKLELDRRKIAEKINILSKKLKTVEKNRVTQRKKRQKNSIPVVALVGYTNAGKSTLLNTLTNSSVYSDDRVFATLETSSKRLRFPNEQDVVLIDTVGFIRDLPKDLEGSFKSTLEELYEADLLVHVIDASSIYYEEHIKSVKNVLYDMGLNNKTTITVFNKIDLISEDKMTKLTSIYKDALFISANKKSTVREVVTNEIFSQAINLKLINDNFEKEVNYLFTEDI